MTDGILLDKAARPGSYEPKINAANAKSIARDVAKGLKEFTQKRESETTQDPKEVIQEIHTLDPSRVQDLLA